MKKILIKVILLGFTSLMTACSSGITYSCTYQDMGANDKLTVSELNNYLVEMKLHTEVDVSGYDINIETLKSEIITAEQQYQDKGIDASINLDESSMLIRSDFNFDYTNADNMDGIIDVGVDANDKSTLKMDTVLTNLENLKIYCK